MDKKIVFFELPVTIIDRIDEESQGESRSLFVSELLEKQLETRMHSIDQGSELAVSLQRHAGRPASGELSLVDGRGMTVGRFDIDTEVGFDELARKVCELSSDPVVRMKARRMR